MRGFIRYKINELRRRVLLDAMIFCARKMMELNKTQAGLTEEGSKKFWEYNTRYDILRNELLRINNS